MGVSRANGGEIGLQRLVIQRLDPVRVDIGAVQVGDLSLVGAGGQIVAGHELGDHRVHPVVRQFAQQVERAVAGAVGRDDHRIDGPAVRIAEEIVTGGHAGVPSGHVEAPAAIARRRGALIAGSPLGLLEQGENGAGLVDTGMVVAVTGQGRRGGQKQGTDSGTDQQFIHGTSLSCGRN